MLLIVVSLSAPKHRILKMNSTQIRLNESLYLPIKSWLVLLAIVISLNVSAKEAHAREIQHSNKPVQDGLVIQKKNGKRTYVVKKEQQIKIWIGEQIVKGAFLELRNDSLSINKKGIVVKYNVNEITEIKLFGNSAKNILGGGVKIWGGVTFVAGFIPLFAWGPVGLFVAVPAWAMGYGIYKIGELISGNRKFNLEKNWEIN